MIAITISTVIATAMPSNAQEAETASAALVKNNTINAAFPDPVTAFVTICDAAETGQINISEKAMDNCVSGLMPRVVTDGSRWTNRSTGAEFNVLWNNRHLWND